MGRLWPDRIARKGQDDLARLSLESLTSRFQGQPMALRTSPHVFTTNAAARSSSVAGNNRRRLVGVAVLAVPMRVS